MKILIDVNLSPKGQHLSPLVLSALNQFETYLEEGALVTVDEKKSRVRILPFKGGNQGDCPTQIFN